MTILTAFINLKSNIKYIFSHHTNVSITKLENKLHGQDLALVVITVPDIKHAKQRRHSVHGSWVGYDVHDA